MPPRRRGGTRTSKRVARPVAGGASLDVLPDEVLHHVLSFLPAQEAVRTCVLGRRCRHLWKSATGFRILCGDEEEAESMKELQGFVEHLLLLRAGAPLDSCQICLLDIEEDEDDMRRIRLWIRHVMLCKVRVLSLSTRFNNGGPWSEEFYLDELPLLSQHLKRLELRGQNLNDSSVDFSGCPALEVLEIKQCGMLDLRKMVSQSLKVLSITGRCEFTDGDRFHVYAPNLVSLRLEVWYGMAPIFSPMPSLVEAAVKIDYGGCDFFYDDTDEGFPSFHASLFPEGI
ncbi:hypothetical protein HU200_016721 [Digitaria exilis]|uniref:F-box domain-containing protein n=1 Tax=Digitaria exilis TaxID=1010633 RepID=A0A835KJK4_9POAL|nr:hypothetical protein HU200_016721 [Digitaria exilis]